MDNQFTENSKEEFNNESNIKKICKYIAIGVSMILPILALLVFTGIHEVYIYNWLWCGFYSCIMICFLVKSKIYKAVAIILNLTVILFVAFGSLMGGLFGLKLVLMHMLIPFYTDICCLI